MSFAIVKTPGFIHAAKRFLRKHRDMCGKMADTLSDIERDPFAPHLRLHPLEGDLDGFHAVSLSYSYRIVLILRLENSEIHLVNIGSHDEVYR